ncbi:DUF11 domain-containing protein, partial [Methanobrevibacter filiformis]|uniref:DUF11 domain-containing protein n=1 Tax=Methanobrevibacter filiformis TaxID=55758 RepID=UPI000AC8AE8E
MTEKLKKFINNKFFGIVLNVMIISLLVSITCVAISGVSASDIHVATNGTDSASGDISAPKATINNALNASTNGDTIKLRNGVYTGLNNNTNLSITKNLTIAGESKGNVIIDAQGQSNHFSIGSGANVTFINITFINGLSQNGGSIYSNGNSLNIVNSTFANNSANEGSAIYNAGENLQVSNSNFINNGNSAIYTINNDSVIYNNSFDNNNAVLAIGFNNSIIDLNDFSSENNLSNNGIVLIVDGNGNIIENATFNGNNNTYGIIVNGDNNNFTDINLHNFETAVLFNTSSKNNIFNRSEVLYNNIGIVILGNNNTIISSIILNNNASGINISGNNNILQYNHIYNSTVGMINSGNNTNANFNWWGKNDIASKYTNTGNNLDLTYWYTLQLSFNNTLNVTANTREQYPFNTTGNIFAYFVLNNLTASDSTLLPYIRIDLYRYNSTARGNDYFLGEDESKNYPVNITEGNVREYVRATIDDEDISLSLEANISDGVYVNVLKVANISSDRRYSNVTFTITVNNSGSTVANNVSVTDMIPQGLDYLDSIPSTESVTYYISNNTLIWDIGSLNPNETQTLNLTFMLNSSTGANLNNRVTVSTDEPNLGFNYSRAYVTQLPELIINIIKVSNDTNVHVGDYITYTITLENRGEMSQLSVNVQDILDPRLKYINSTSNSTSSNITINNDTVLWHLDGLGVNETVSLNITVQVMGTGIITNTAEVSGKYNPNFGVNISSVNITVSDEVNVSIIKVANVTNASVGDTVNYTLTVTNNGLTNASGVFVIDNLENTNKLQYVSDDPSKGTYNRTSGIWTIGNLTTGETVTLNLTVLVTGTGNITNIANVTTKENNTGDPDDNETVTVNDTVNVSIVKVANVTVASVGDNVLYTITVTNNGLTNATGVFVIE